MILARSPFRLIDRERYDLAFAGRSVTELLADVKAPDHSRLLVMVDDRMVPPDRWDMTIPAAGSLVVVRAVPAAGAGGIAIINNDKVTRIYSLIFMLALSFAAPGIGSAASAAVGGGDLVTAIATVAVVLAGNLAVNALIKPPPPDPVMRALSKGQDLIDGTRNRIEKLAVVPQVCGSPRYVPPQAMRPFTESRSGKQYVTQMFDFGIGPIDFRDLMIGNNPIFAEGTTLLYDRVMTSNGFYNHIQVELRRGVADEAPITLVSEEIHEEPLSLILAAGQPGGVHSVVRRTLTDVTEISIDLSWPALTWTHDGGSSSSLTVIVRIEYRSATGTNWTKVADVTTTRNIAALVRITKTWAVTKGQYDVRLTRTSQPQAQSGGVDKTYWTSLRSKRMGDPLKESGHARIITRITGSEVVNGVIDTLSAIAERYALAWDGAAWTLSKTRNAMAYYRLILQDRGNRLAIADADIAKRVDLARLQEVAADCDAERRPFDFVFDTEQSVSERLKIVCAAVRGSFTQRDGKFSIVRDNPDAGNSGVFTPANSWGYRWRKLFPRLPHALRVRFQNPFKDWTLDEEYVYDDGYSKLGLGGTTAASVFDDFAFQGLIDASLVWDDARYYLAVNRLRDMVHTWYTDWQWRACEVGDQVKIAHDAISTGLAYGNVSEVLTSGSNVTGIVLDQMCPMEAAKSYGVLFRRSSDWVCVTRTIVTNEGQQQVLMFTTPISVAGDKPSVGDHVSFGIAGSETRVVQVTAIKPGPDLTAMIEAQDLKPAVYDADADTVARPDWAAGSIFGAVPANTRDPFDAGSGPGFGASSSGSGTINVHFPG